jgi:hypothetical protein
MGGIRRIAWALRKAHLPVARDGLVLDVGAGGCPYPRSDVLLDRLIGAQHRCGSPLLVDRPVVIADAQKMPFRDKVFEFVVASHILEHMKEPHLFLDELSRVGKAGYIETPNVLFERLDPYSIHCLEIMSLDGRLYIRKKGRVAEDLFMQDLQIHRRDPSWAKEFFGAPDLFHVRHFWHGRIDYEVVNPGESCDWIDAIAAEGEEGETTNEYVSGGWRGLGLRVLRKYYAWRRRGRHLDWLSVLACPTCRGPLLRGEGVFHCDSCRVAYPSDPYPDFTRTA